MGGCFVVCFWGVSFKDVSFLEVLLLIGDHFSCPSFSTFTTFGKSMFLLEHH